ncbi:hypothetical protein CPB86DRAFT_878406 [Serendipita vermifera]|nr:hypothetical protein CPB86DRAFT_878406 [Serendipita vermifera]
MITTRNQTRYNLRSVPRKVERSQVGPPPPKKRRAAPKPRKTKAPKNKKRSKGHVSPRKKGQKDSQLQEIHYPPRTLYQTDQWKKQYTKGKQRGYIQPRNLKAELYLRRRKRAWIGAPLTHLGSKARDATMPVLGTRTSIPPHRTMDLMGGDDYETLTKRRKHQEAAGFLTSLHIPVLPPIIPKNWTSRHCLAWLGWSIDVGGNPHGDSLLDLSNAMAEDRVPLTRSGGRIRKRVDHLFKTVKEEVIESLDRESERLSTRIQSSSFQIPEDWKPFRDVPLEVIYKRRQGTVHSEEDPERELVYLSGELSSGTTGEASDATVVPGSSKKKRRSKFTRYVIDTVAGQRVINILNPEAVGMTLLSHTSRYFQTPSLRFDWEMLISIEPSVFFWTRQTVERLQERDSSRHGGNLVINDASPNLDLVLSNGIAKILSIYTKHVESLTENELQTRIGLGRMFADLMSTDNLRAACLVNVSHPRPWGSTSAPFVVDVACIPHPRSLQWSTCITPVLLAAQYEDGDRRHAAEILAQAFHCTIIIFILYYLDSRLTESDPIPPWMILFGVIYNERGFIVQGYHPTVNFRGDIPSPGNYSFKWAACSREIADFDRSFQFGPASRSRSLAAILRIHSHTRYIMKKLKNWSGYKQIVQPFVKA